jgi:hypothetical protein
VPGSLFSGLLLYTFLTDFARREKLGVPPCQKTMSPPLPAFLRVPFCLVLLLMMAASPCLALEVAGVRLPETVKVGPTELVLNGAGVKRKFWIDLYVCALYLPEKHSATGEILSTPGAKRLVLRFTYGNVGAERLRGYWLRGFQKKLSPQEFARIRGRLTHLADSLRAVRKGDVLGLDYLPPLGTQVWLNDQVLATVKGEDFYRAVLKVWLDDLTGARG